MNCKVCGSNGWINSILFKEPDKYEKWVGIENVKRRWRRCLKCGLWHHWRNYEIEELEKIYSDGYRNPKFRGESIRKAFLRVYALQDDKSENARRIEWLTGSSFGIPETMLDIGSGLGVFPVKMKSLGIDVHCVEYNNDSIDLIERIGIPCTRDMPDKKFDAVTITHVLEHIEDPIDFLRGLHKSINSSGKLFIEVPDAVEFGILFPTHDDFNSCHTHFYDVSSLCRTLERAEYNVIDIHREHYKERNLHRIMVVCKRM